MAKGSNGSKIGSSSTTRKTRSTPVTASSKSHTAAAAAAQTAGRNRRKGRKVRDRSDVEQMNSTTAMNDFQTRLGAKTKQSPTKSETKSAIQPSTGDLAESLAKAL